VGGGVIHGEGGVGVPCYVVVVPSFFGIGTLPVSCSLLLSSLSLSYGPGAPAIHPMSSCSSAYGGCFVVIVIFPIGIIVIILFSLSLVVCVSLLVAPIFHCLPPSFIVCPSHLLLVVAPNPVVPPMFHPMGSGLWGW
jgi:hypothetical protein